MYRLFILVGVFFLIVNCNSQKVEKPFMDPKVKRELNSLKNIAVFTTKNVINKKMLITRVYHDADGSWQFFDDESTNSNENVMVVAFGQVIQRDSSLIDLLEMPFSHLAQRKTVTDKWIIAPFKESDE